MEQLVLKDWINIVGVLAEVILACTAVFIAWRVYRLTIRLETTNLANAALASVNLLNQTALSSPENLQAFDELYADGRDKSDSAKRKRWATFLALQTHQQFFLARDAGMTSGDLADRLDEQVLTLLLRDNEVQSLLNERGYDSRFVAYCEDLVREHAASDENRPEA